MEYSNHSRFIKASSFKNTTVQNAVGDKIGSIEDLMVDSHNGRAVYAVLSVDTGFLNMGSKYFAIPWEAFAFDTAQKDVFILNVDKDRLKDAPGFEKDEWPDHPQHEFLAEVHSYYGFERATEPTPPLGTGTRTKDTITQRHDRDPNPKQSNFI